MLSSIKWMLAPEATEMETLQAPEGIWTRWIQCFRSRPRWLSALPKLKYTKSSTNKSLILSNLRQLQLCIKVEARVDMKNKRSRAQKAILTTSKLPQSTLSQLIQTSARSLKPNLEPSRIIRRPKILTALPPKLQSILTQSNRKQAKTSKNEREISWIDYLLLKKKIHHRNRTWIWFP